MQTFRWTDGRTSMPVGEYQVTDVYFGAFALMRGAKLLRSVRNEKGYLDWIFEADQMRELFQEWRNPQLEVNVKQFLDNVRYLRGMYHVTE